MKSESLIVPVSLLAYNISKLSNTLKEKVNVRYFWNYS